MAAPTCLSRSGGSFYAPLPQAWLPWPFYIPVRVQVFSVNSQVWHKLCY
jgi:hypothetical protein